jgi:predicted transcriptional regulator
MLPCSDVHWKLLPAILRELTLSMGKEGMAQSKIAAALGTTSAAVSQYVSGKRGGEKLEAKAVSACRKLAKKLAAGKVTKGELDFEVAKIVVLAKKSKLGDMDPCAICMSTRVKK